LKASSGTLDAIPVPYVEVATTIREEKAFDAMVSQAPTVCMLTVRARSVGVPFALTVEGRHMHIVFTAHALVVRRTPMQEHMLAAIRGMRCITSPRCGEP